MRIAIWLFTLATLSGCATSHLGPQKAPEYFVTPSVRYLSEADGEFSAVVKKAVTPALQSAKDIDTGFLVNFEYPDGNKGICLCLSPASAESMRTAENIGKAFGLVAEQGVHLDIMFISDDSLRAVEQIAKPFYVRL